MTSVSRSSAHPRARPSRPREYGACDGRCRDQASDDDHRRQSDDGSRTDGGNRRHHQLLKPTEAGELLRPQPAGASVRSRRHPPRAHQRDWLQPCQDNAGGARVAGGEEPGAAVRLLCPHPRPPPASLGRRLGGAQAGRPLLANADQGRGLSVGMTGIGGQQAARHGAAGRRAAAKGNRRGPAYADNAKALREQEMHLSGQAEKRWQRSVGAWRPRRPTFVSVNARGARTLPAGKA